MTRLTVPNNQNPDVFPNPNIDLLLSVTPTPNTNTNPNIKLSFSAFFKNLKQL